VNNDKILRQLGLLNDYLRQLKDLKKQPIESFKQNTINRAATERLLQVCIETTLNIGNHIIATRGYRNPKDYADIFKVLEEEKLISADFSDSLQQMARFRNRLVHVYWDIDIEVVYEILQSRLIDFEEFAKMVVREINF
jgi:uncharacterized protein YutE (UPF0331/DUF86 family)